MVTVHGSSAESPFLGQAKATVKNGSFRAGAFSNNGKPLKPGITLLILRVLLLTYNREALGRYLENKERICSGTWC